MHDDTPFTKNETVKVPDRAGVGKIKGYEDGKWVVLFEDGTTQPYPETALKRTQILKG